MKLAPLGEAVRHARHASGLTLRDLAARSGVSQRFLSDLEKGRGNISIGKLWAIGRALDVPLAELVSPLDASGARPFVALVGLRGAGKSTIGQRLADSLHITFVELDLEIEADAGLPLPQIFEIHGEAYYRRLERDALERIAARRRDGAVLAAGGGLVTDPLSWRLLRRVAKTVWLRARPEDHYGRVMAQGDTRPMRNRPSAMAELRALLAARAPLYAEADVAFDTSALGLERAVDEIVRWVEDPGRPSTS